MKPFFAIMILFTFLYSLAGEEFGYFNRADSTDPWDKVVSLKEGDVMVFLSCDSTSWAMNLTMPGGYSLTLSAESQLGFYAGYFNTELMERRTIVGPCDVAPLNGGRYIAYKIIRAFNQSVQPNNVITLPTDLNGNMQVIMETSDDLLSWEQVYSFTQHTNQNTRYFRTRLVQ